MKQDKLTLRGEVKYWLTDLDDNMIEGTMVEDHNEIQTDLKKYLAKALASETNTASLSTFFTEDPVVAGVTSTYTSTYAPADQESNPILPAGGGICLARTGMVDSNANPISSTTGYEAVDDLSIIGVFASSKNAGGTGSETYVEFYGYITGSTGGTDIQSSTDKLVLGYDLDGVSVAAGDEVKYLDSVYATYPFSADITIDVNRRFHFYWKIQF